MTEDSKLSAIEGATTRSWKAYGRSGTSLGIAIVALTVSGLALAVAVYAAFRSQPQTPPYAYPAPQTYAAYLPPQAAPQAPQVWAAPRAEARPEAPPVVTPVQEMDDLTRRLLGDPAMLTPAAPSASAPTPQDITRATEEAYERAQSILRSEENDRLAINRVLGDATSAGQILGVLDQATGIDVPATDATVAGGKTLFAFFDPRCPYCHQAILGLEGAVNVKWLPVLTLGSGGEPVTRQILGEMTIEENEAGEPSRVHLTPDEGRAARLRLAAAGQTARLPELTADEEQDKATQYLVGENIAVLLEFYGPQRNLLAVPTFVVPRADGTAVVIRGYSEGSKAEILGAMGVGG